MSKKKKEEVVEEINDAPHECELVTVDGLTHCKLCGADMTVPTPPVETVTTTTEKVNVKKARGF